MTLSDQTVTCFGHCDYFMKCRAIVILLLLGLLLHPGPKFITCIMLKQGLKIRLNFYNIKSDTCFSFYKDLSGIISRNKSDTRTIDYYRCSRYLSLT